MKKIQLLSLFFLVGLVSCYSLKYGGDIYEDSKLQKLYLVNGTYIDLKWYTKDFYSNQTETNRYSYTWFIKTATNSRSYGSSNDSSHFIGVNYNDSTDTLFNEVYSRQDLIQKDWKLIIGDQNIESKIVLGNWPDTIHNIPLEFNNDSIGNGYNLIFSTNQKNISYEKLYNYQDKKLAEGPLLPDYLIDNKKPKRKYGLSPVGVWKYYFEDETFETDTIPFMNIENLKLVDK